MFESIALLTYLKELGWEKIFIGIIIILSFAATLLHNKENRKLQPFEKGVFLAVLLIMFTFGFAYI